MCHNEAMYHGKKQQKKAEIIQQAFQYAVSVNDIEHAKQFSEYITDLNLTKTGVIPDKSSALNKAHNKCCRYLENKYRKQGR